MSIMIKIKKFLNKLFWIDKFEGKSKLFTFIGKFFMYGYIVTIFLCLISLIFSFIVAQDLSLLGSLPILIVIYPIMYRFVMGFQRLLFRI